MKKISLALLLTVAISCASSLPPAEPASSMMEQADTVILSIDEDPEIAHQNVRKHLINRGFVIKKSDIDELEIQTAYRKFGPIILGILGSYSMQIFTSVEDSTIRFSGELSSGSRVENRGGSNSPLRASWEKLVEIAKDYPHKEIYFSRD